MEKINPPKYKKLPRRETNARTKNIVIRVTEQEWYTFQTMAHMKGVTVSDLVREMVTGRMKYT